MPLSAGLLGPAAWWFVLVVTTATAVVVDVRLDSGTGNSRLARTVALLFFGAAGAPGVVWRAMAMAGTSFTFLLALYGLTQGYDPELTQFQLVERVEWIPELGVRYFVGVDGIREVSALSGVADRRVAL